MLRLIENVKTDERLKCERFVTKADFYQKVVSSLFSTKPISSFATDSMPSNVQKIIIKQNISQFFSRERRRERERVMRKCVIEKGRERVRR